MTNAQLEIQIILSLVSIACALPGIFLVLKKMSLITDAISHSILPGIVIGFFITENFSSPLLIFMATLSGILTVILVEYIQKIKLVKEDTAIGLIFPSFFSLGVILISQKARDIHIDTDVVLLGEVAFAPFNRWIYDGIDMGPKSLWVMGFILAISILLLVLFYKELKIVIFDPGLATSLGFSPIAIHYGLMTVSSVTTVGAFDTIGSILAVAFFIVPAACVYLLTNSLKKLLIYSPLLGIFSSIFGYWIAHSLDTSISGTIATVLGIIFFITYLFAPNRGYISNWHRRRKQKVEAAVLLLLMHLSNHKEKSESSVHHLQYHIKWSVQMAKKILKISIKNELIKINGDFINITKKGVELSKNASYYISENESLEKKSFFQI